jgi:uncharacterized protein YjbI with pentapeptide repeats
MTSKDFSNQNLRGRSFQGENLENVNFSYADIRGADFSSASLRGANFTGAKAGLRSYGIFIFSIFLLCILPLNLQIDF